jgi:hypothetical protein
MRGAIELPSFGTSIWNAGSAGSSDDGEFGNDNKPISTGRKIPIHNLSTLLSGKKEPWACRSHSRLIRYATVDSALIGAYLLGMRWWQFLPPVRKRLTHSDGG